MTEEKINKIQCPYCAEYISDDTEICEYCGEKIVKEKEPFQQARSKKQKLKFPIKYVLISVAILLVIMLAIFVISKKSSRNEISSFDSGTIEQTTDTTQEMNEARLYFNDKNYDKAAELFQKEIDNNSNPIAYFYMGRIYQERNYIDMAVDNFKKSIDLKGDFFEADFALEKIYFDKFDMAKTIEYGEKAVKLKPEHEESLKMLAQAYSRQGDSEQALTAYKKLYKINPKDYDANKLIGNDYFDKQQYKEALSYLAKAFELNNNSEDGLLLARCYIEREYYTNAIKTLNKILKNDPYNYSASELLSEANQKKSEYVTNNTLKPAITQNNDSNANDVDFGPYMRELQRRIKMNWDPPQGSESKRVVVLFKVAKDGRLLSSRIFQSSDVYDVDRAALNAVALTAPFRRLPSDFNGQSIDIQFTFDYNVFGASQY